MSVLAGRRFEALLVEVDGRRMAIVRDLEARWPAWSQEVEDAVQESFAALPRYREAIERFSAKEGRAPCAADLEAKWRAGATAKMVDARRRRQGRAKQGPREFVSIDGRGDAVSAAQRVAPDSAEDLLRQQFEEVLMSLRNPEDRRYARIRLLEMTRAGDDGQEVVLTMAEARAELGWTQRQWNTRGARVRAQIAEAAMRIPDRAWCEEHFRAIGPWINAELDPHMHQRVSLHVEGCERCSATALRLQGELRQAARHVFDPSLAVTLASGLGLLGWMKAKIGLGVGAAAAGGSTAATGMGGSAIGGTLVTKTCAGLAVAGCAAVVGAPLIEAPKPQPPPKTKPAARAAQAKRPATVRSSSSLGVLPPRRLGPARRVVTSGAPARSTPARATTRRPSAPRRQQTVRPRVRAERATARAARALSPVGSSTPAAARPSPVAVRADQALGIQPAPPVGGANSSQPPASDAAASEAAKAAFGP